MSVQQIFSDTNLNPAYGLRYSWTGWPSGPTFQSLPEDVILQTIRGDWESDGLRLLEWNWSKKKIQLTFSTQPTISPVFLANRAKGRLQHALRKARAPQTFSRKLSVRSIGNNTTFQVENYIKNQVRNEAFVDPIFARKMEELILVNSRVDLSAPNLSSSGRYWYNLHLVLIIKERSKILDLGQLADIRDGSLELARQQGYGISTLSPMLDHLHVALRGDHSQSPLEIALTFQAHLTSWVGKDLWAENFYTGTFSEYSMNAIRRPRDAACVLGVG